MLSICTNGCSSCFLQSLMAALEFVEVSWSLTSLLSTNMAISETIDGRVNNVLLHTVPNANGAQLQLIDTVHTTFIYSVLHNTPDFIIH